MSKSVPIVNLMLGLALTDNLLEQMTGKGIVGNLSELDFSTYSERELWYWWNKNAE